MCTRLKWENTGRRSEGFTLIEIMVVVIILGILAATIIPQFAGTTQDAMVTKARSDIATLELLLETYAVHMQGRYPTTEEGLKALVVPPSDGSQGWKGPYLKEIPNDPWKHPYSYRSPGLHGTRSFDLWSRGADGADGGEGPNADVTNWQEK